MRIPVRIVVPVVTAVLVTGGALGYLWWQLQGTESRLSDIPRPNERNTGDDLPVIDPIEELTGNDDALLALRQGDLLALQGDWKQAQEKYDEAVRKGGGLAALRKLAQAQLQRRDMKGIRYTMIRMRDQGAREEDLMLLDAIVDMRTGELVRARTSLTQASDSPQKHYGLAILGMIEGNHEAAKAEIPLVLQGFDPLLRSHAKKFQAAYDEYAKFPESPEIHLITLLSKALAETQQCELALPLLHQVVQERDDYRDAWVVQGYCELVTERAETAVASLEKAYNLDPEKPEIQYFLARAYASTGDHGNAVTFAQYALKNGFEPEPEVRTFLAREAEQVGSTMVAIEQYRTLMQAPTAELSSFAKFITLSVTANRNDDALAAATEATKKWPTDGRAFELLGYVHEAMQNKTEAKANYEKAFAIDPGLTSAREKAEKLR